MKTVEAIYESGMLKPVEALQLREHEKVRILILPQSSPQRTRLLPPGLGEFDSGHTDTAERAEEVLIESGFGSSR